MKRSIFLYALAAGLFAALIVYSAEARAGAAAGARLWGGLLVPSLLPYFAAAGLLSRLGAVEAFGRRAAPLGRRLLGLSAAGTGIFLLALTGGYPLGAAAAAEAVRAGRLSREEAGALLRFGDNTGPAFAVGALGVGVFGRAEVGLALWGIHALCALALGILLPRRVFSGGAAAPRRRALSFSEALTDSLSAAVTALLSIGGYVILFSALLAVGDALGFPGAAAKACARITPLDEGYLRALFTGALELSSGIGAMASLPRDAGTFTLGAFLLGWGGVCVHLQSAAVTAGTGIDLRQRLWGKLLHGALSALAACALAPILL